MEQHDEYLKALEGLAENYNFKIFMKRVRQLKDETVREATAMESIGSDLKTAALLGAIKTYQEILDEYTSYASAPID